MLNLPDRGLTVIASESAEASTGAEVIDFDRLLALFRRQVWVVLLGAVVGIVLGGAYVLTAVPLYTSSVSILIDKGRSKVIDELSGASGVLQDEAEMLSQVELLRSEQLAQAVVAQLKLTEDKQFMEGNPSLSAFAIGRLKAALKQALSWFAPALLTEQDVAISDDQRVQAAVKILQNGVNVSRVGRTYVLKLEFTAATPGIAASVSRAYGEAYLDDQLQSKYEATRRASVWLQDRIGELKQQSFDADLKVQKYRSDNNLISAGGQLVSEQQLSEINTQLIAAQAATAEAKARVDQIDELIKLGRTDAVVNDALVSSTINSLREKYLTASRTKTEIEQKLGPDHVQVVRLRNEMAELERLIFGELRRIGESYRSSYNVALSREESLKESLQQIVGVNAASNTTQVRLRELERESATFKSLYESFLQRYQQAVQQQSFPVSDARVISPASPPKVPSFPNRSLVLSLFLLLGTLSGAGLAAFREYRDRFFRTGDQVRSELKTEFLGFAPRIRNIAPRTKSTSSAAAKPGDRLWAPSSVNVFTRSHPLSSFSETLRNVKVAADMALTERTSKVIGVVSCLPSEGKTTISSNLAVLLAMQGARVVLIDGDLRNPGLTRSLETRPQTGLIEAVLDETMADPSLLVDASGQLSILPTVLKHRVSHTSELLSSLRMAKLLSRYRDDYDYTIVDLPPIGPVVDAKAFANRVDAFVFVVEWGRTSRQLVRSMLQNHPVFHQKCLGVILNKSDESKMKLYQSFGSAEYYAARYQSYYRD